MENDSFEPKSEDRLVPNSNGSTAKCEELKIESGDGFRTIKKTEPVTEDDGQKFKDTTSEDLSPRISLDHDYGLPSNVPYQKKEEPDKS